MNQLFLDMKKNKVSETISLSYYSDEMKVTKKILNENNLKLTYHKDSLSNLERKHKYWSKKIGL